MRFPRPFALILCLTLLPAVTPQAHARELLTRVAPGSGRLATLTARPGATLLAVDRAALDQLRGAGSGTLALPLADGSAVELELERRELFAPGAQVTYTDGSGPHSFTPDVAVFRGRVNGEPDSWAMLTLTRDEVRLTLSRGGEQLLLMPSAAPEPGAAGPTLHVLSREAAVLPKLAPWECGVDGANEAALDHGEPARPRANPYSIELDAPRRTFTIAVDCDSEIVGKFGGNLTAASNYIATLLATVSLVYERDLEVTLNVGYLNFWTTTDPYTAVDTQNQLPQFRSWWNANRGGVPRSLAHLLSGRSLGGGIAYIDVLCASTSNGYGYGVSAIDCAYAYPTNATTWDAEVVAHELGHNFGSWHTHSCNWSALGYITPPGATIDTCFASEGGCQSAPLHVPVDKGTIMSYCHQLSGGINNLRMDFHPACITRMRERVNLAACATNPAIAPPRNVIASAIPTGVRIAWDASSTAGVTGYDVYRSRSMLDFAPAWIGSTSGLSFDDSGLGLWFYKVRAHTTGDTSGFGAEVKFDMCAIGVDPEQATGSTPIAVASAELTGDGIADLVTLDQAAGSVSLLAGGGSGGIGDGTFAAATSVVTTPASPQCLLVTDAGNDGLADLVVGTGADSALWIYPGGGTGGVPNGTFGAGTRLPLGFVPAGVASADFDENGVPDFVVAGGASGLTLLFGNGAGGVPDGTYGAPVLVSFGATTRGVVVGDFDENGIWDIATTTNTYLRVLRGQGVNGVGNGTFMAPTQHNASANAWDLVTGDFNQDGITDLFTVYSTVGGAGMLLGNGSGGVGSGTFPAAATIVTVGSNARGPCVGDWNADGVPDLAFVNNNANKTVSILIGKGNGTFNTAITWTAGTNPYALAVGDWNHDGGIDLAAVNRGANSVTTLLAGCGAELSLTLTNPAGGDTLIESVNHLLTWTKDSHVGAVDVEVSRDGGASWAAIARNLTGTSFDWTATAPATSQARVRVVDVARRWASDASGDFTILPQSVLAATPAVPSRFELLGAWPNPARGDFSVSLALPQGGRGARLELLDLAGRRVAEVPLGSYGPGVHAVPLRSAGLHPGVYLVRLAGHGALSTRKVALLN
ncbi:MAG: VCBS repeat-containing protein [Candidatus Eisenbacteria bacterium]|nr:VCBS repeat-containing protein [Candidatus Eisenbacteria bacterium]